MSVFKKIFGGSKKDAKDDKKQQTPPSPAPTPVQPPVVQNPPKNPVSAPPVSKALPPSSAKQPSPRASVTTAPTVKPVEQPKPTPTSAPVQPTTTAPKPKTASAETIPADLPLGGFRLYQKMEEEHRNKEPAPKQVVPEISEEEKERIKQEKLKRKEEKRKRDKELMEKLQKAPEPDQKAHDLMYKVPQATVQILKAVSGNIIKNPKEEKFRQLKMNNPKINENITRFPQAVQILEIIGFVVDGDLANMPETSVNVGLLQKIVDHCDNRLGLNGAIIGVSAEKKKREKEQNKIKEEIRKQMELDRKYKE
jgi:hypothetical protein